MGQKTSQPGLASLYPLDQEWDRFHLPAAYTETVLEPDNNFLGDIIICSLKTLTYQSRVSSFSSTATSHAHQGPTAIHSAVLLVLTFLPMGT